MSINLPTSVQLLSSIAQNAGPTSTQVQWHSATNSSTDPLDGSLGLYLLMCFFIGALVLFAAYVLWRVRLHRFRCNTLLPRHAIPTPNGSNVSLLSPSTPSAGIESTAGEVNAKSESRLPFNAMRIRTPIQRLKLFRSVKDHWGAPSMPIWQNEMSSRPAMSSVPSIVISQCSPILPSPGALSVGRSTSSDSLHTLESGRRLSKPSPVLQASSTNIPTARRATLASPKPPMSKKSHRQSRSMDKENHQAVRSASPRSKGSNGRRVI